MDVIEYISRYIPPILELPVIYTTQEIYHDSHFKKKRIRWKTGIEMFQFRLFINHPHYDIRIGYFPYNDIIFKKDKKNTTFLYLIENIDDEKSLLNCLNHLRNQLKKDNMLSGIYKTKTGYTKKIFINK